MAILNSKGEIISNKIKKVKPKNKADSIEGRSFYFLGKEAEGYPLYVGYIKKDLGEKIFVWLKKRTTNESRDCVIPKSIIKYEKSIEYK